MTAAALDCTKVIIPQQDAGATPVEPKFVWRTSQGSVSPVLGAVKKNIT
jgi:hypothetical protein